MTHMITPYGDLMDDGKVQMSFTLPIPVSDKAREAARILLIKMGFENPEICHMEKIDEAFTFFIAYGATSHHIDVDKIKIERHDNPQMTFDEINEYIQNNIRRKLVVVGACIGSDAHTVGIDAMFNMKGFNHDWGFERYLMLEAHNLRAQVAVEDLADQVVKLNADAVLVSRIVTQRDQHIKEFKKFLKVLESKTEVQPHLLKICGGPRISHSDALKWGFDAGFGPGTYPSQVASFIAHNLAKRIKI